jgi:nucleotide-binding universal stress UspA family protein
MVPEFKRESNGDSTPNNPEGATRMTVIVGVDGSAGARAALEFAMDEAVRRQTALRVIAVVQLPAYGFAAMSGFVPPSPAVLVENVNRAAQQHVDDIVAARQDGGAVAISVEAQAGQPAQVLCAAAGDADLLVVGRSGHGSVTESLLGSVGLHCVMHAQSPVTVVRAGPVDA